MSAIITNRKSLYYSIDGCGTLFRGDRKMLKILLEYIPLVSGISAVIAACALGVGVYQLRMSMRWNRLQAAFTYFPNPLSLENLENELDEKIRFWSRSPQTPITEAEVRLLMFQADIKATEIQQLIQEARATLKSLGRTAPTKDEQFLLEMRQAGRKLKAYLNEIERYCAAVNSGVVDEHTAYHIYFAKFIGHYKKVEGLIEFVQRTREASVYEELKKLSERWKDPPKQISPSFPPEWLSFRKRRPA